MKQIKTDMEPGQVLPLRRPKTALRDVLPDEAQPVKTDFSGLAEKLEERLGKIEAEIKNSLSTLEADIQKISKTKNVKNNEKEMRAELDQLASKLEARFEKTLTSLGRKKEKESENFDRIKRLTSRLVKILSFDFYKGVLGSLGEMEYQEEIDPFGMDQRLISRIKPLFDFLYQKYWRVTTTGIDNVPADGRALIVGNHSGTVPYDGAMVKTAVLNEHTQRKDARFLVEDFVYHMPIMGTFMYRIGGVRACQENAERLLSAGHLVVVFPEGVKGIGKYYHERYQLQRFGRGGFVKLCMKTKSPLVPVGIVGAEEIHPIIMKSNILAKTIGLPYIPITPTFPWLGLLGCIPLPSKWSIHFGEPIRFDDYGPEALEDELLIHKLSEEVRGKIQGIVFDLLKKRASVWRG